METRHEVTDLLIEAGSGNRAAFDRLLPLVYRELQRMAHVRLRAERDGHTLDTTALVHETYLKLVSPHVEWRDRAHFFAVAAAAMRQVLIDSARKHNAAKRGWGRPSPARTDAAVRAVQERADRLLAIDEALTRLARLQPRMVRVVECRFFGGLTENETAAALGVTPRTVRRDWLTARSWLFQTLQS